MDWKTASRIVFALTFIGIGVIGLVSGTFAPVWNPVPEAVPARAILPWLSTVAALACGAGLLAMRTAPWAALALTIFLILWTAAFKLPFIVRGPLVEGSYQSNGENWVLIAAAGCFTPSWPGQKSSWRATSAFALPGCSTASR